MPNHLIHATSPYLLQHAENPVDWYPWGSEALNRAKKENNPIFLSIGYSSCHWCHVMAHESFEDPDIAEFLNQYFINIKVDREERPDLDSIYMAAVVTMNQQGGWPMSVFLTPDLKAFYSGTYFPPQPRNNLPSFREVIRAVAAAWKQERDQVIQSSEHLFNHIQQNNQIEYSQQDTLHPEVLSEALNTLLTQYDWAYGGWGNAPKFPQPMAIEFLLLQAFTGNREAADAALHNLDAMSRGGMYDVIGGGFHRYSTDTGWLVPHFEKMLYDNAQLAQVYLHARLQTGDKAYEKVACATLNFLLREMRHPLGGFYASIDADSPDGEGAFYVWKLDEIRTILRDPEELRLFTSTYPVSDTGNFDGMNILQRSRRPEKIAAELGLDLAEYQTRLESIHSRLLAVRNSRIRPPTDTKILLSWNALTIIAFAEAGRYLNRTDYLDAARGCAKFILDNMKSSGGLVRTWRDGKSAVHAFLEDYAVFILGLLTLYQADGDSNWYRNAATLAEEMLEKFTDPDGGFFDSAEMAEELVFRPKELQDNAIPSGNSLAMRSLQEFSAFSHKPGLQITIDRSLAAIQEMLSQYPTAFSSWLLAYDQEFNQPRQVAIVWNSDTSAELIQPLLTVPLNEYRPRIFLARSELPLPDHAPDLLRDRPTINALPTAYVCEQFTCRLPVTNPDDLRHQLE